MPHYNRPLEFGISLSPQAADWEQLAAAAVQADRLGLDFIGIQDHPYQRRFLDTMALLAALATRTTSLRVFPDVACLPLRHPAMLATEAASIDVMSGGRLELGLGAGAFWDAIEAMGGPRRSPGESLDALVEATQLIRRLWSGERGIRHDGDHYTIDGIHSGPVPSHEIEIWFGVYGPRAVRLVGRVADGWLPSLGRISLDELDSRHELIDEEAEAAGRNPVDIRRLANIGGQITDGSGGDFLEGPDGQWYDQLTELNADHGIDTFIYWPSGDVESQIGRFAQVAASLRRSGVSTE